ncbi:MAG: Transcriptional regulator, HxlR family, partial [uncultured Solirubrobacteraceae bacterium]
ELGAGRSAAGAAQERPGAADPRSDVRRAAQLLSVLPPGDRADRAPLDGRDRQRPAAPQPHAIRSDRRGRARALRPPAVRAHEGARAPRRRRAHGAPRASGARGVRAHRDGARARPRGTRAGALGTALAGV